MSKAMTLKPHVSEKSYGLSQARNTYAFDVPVDSNKLTVAAAVAQQFGVKVEAVNIAVGKGKVKLSYRRGSRPVSGQRPGVKRAYVRLKTGDTIPVFAAVEAEAKKTEKAEKK